MVPMNKVQAGLAAFLDKELIPSLTGWDKVFVGGTATLAVMRLPAILDYYPMIAALGAYDKKNNQVDVAALYQAFSPYMDAEPIPAKIPILNITMRIGKQELDTLYRYIKEA